MQENLNYVRLRDGKKIYGWIFDKNEPTKVKSVYINYPNKESILVKADKPLPEWSKKIILSSDVGKALIDKLPTAHGYFEYIINDRAFIDFGEISVVDEEDGLSLSGSPFVAFSQKDLSVVQAPTSEFVGIADDDVLRLDFHQFKKRVLAAQANGKQVLVHPPFISWNIPLFQRPQHMALAFSRVGAVSIYFTNNVDENIADIINNSGDLYICPPEYFDLFLQEISDAHIILYSTSPASIVSSVNNSNNRIVYEYVDHIDPKISAGWVQGCLDNQNSLTNSTAYAVVATAKVLYQEMLERFDLERVALVPNGVSCTHFQVVRDEAKIPSRYRQIMQRKRPIVGYYGAIAPWLDYALIEKLADLMPSHDFVYIGPLYLKDKADLPVRDNIFWYGQVDYTVLPHFAAWFDCCFIPFEDGQIAATTSPLKLFEYFALGKPVVVTSAMQECVQFSIVRHGKTARQVADSIQAALGDWSDEDVQNSIRLAHEHDWKRRAEVYVQFIDGLNRQTDVHRSYVDVAEVFVAPHAWNVVGGALGCEVAGDEIVLLPNGVKIRSGVNFGWRLRLPDALPADDLVMSFDFKMVFGGEGASAECEFTCGEERILFSSFNSDLFKTFRIRRAFGVNELVFTVRGKAGLTLFPGNTMFKLKNFLMLPNTAPLYCNHVPIERRNKDIQKIKETALPTFTSLLIRSELDAFRRNLLSNSIQEYVALPNKIRPAEIALSETPKPGELMALILDTSNLDKESAKSLRIRLSSPHFNPQSLGRIFYYLAIDETVVYYEDISAYSGLNELFIEIPKNNLEIGVIASKNVGSWKWGDASKLQVFDIEISHENSVKECIFTSDAGVALEEKMSVQDLFTVINSKMPATSVVPVKTQSKKLSKRAISAIKNVLG